jgi:hypothetical protein
VLLITAHHQVARLTRPLLRPQGEVNGGNADGLPRRGVLGSTPSYSRKGGDQKDDARVLRLLGRASRERRDQNVGALSYLKETFGLTKREAMDATYA